MYGCYLNEGYLRILGFDGVLVSGCYPGDCHYQTGNYRARRRMTITKKFLEYVGVDPSGFKPVGSRPQREENSPR